jgi:hypothetical protein
MLTIITTRENIIITDESGNKVILGLEENIYKSIFDLMFIFHETLKLQEEVNSIKES